MPRIPKCFFLILGALSWSLTAQSQSISFEITADIEVLDSNGVRLGLSGVGGLNQPQIYNLDIDNDGVLDLFVFDQTGGKTVSLINDGNGNFSYRPEYDHIFPGPITTWVVLKDYNADGLPDFWFFSNAVNNIVLYRNITKQNDNYAQFELADEDLRAYNFNDSKPDTTGLYCDVTNIPAIEDVDGDGDIDFLTLQQYGFGVTLFLNNTVERNLPLDPPQFEMIDECWGDFEERFGSNEISYLRDTNCRHKIYRYLKKKHAGGASLLLLDNDDDGDMDLVMGNAGLNNLNLLVNGKVDNGLKLDSMVANDSLYPGKSRAVNIETFPAAFYQDVNNDKVKDLIVTMHMADKNSFTYRETGHLYYYENKGKNSKPEFILRDTVFLTGQMADHGGYGVPLLWDMDNDKDLDLILATNGDFGITGDSADYLMYYENIGSVTVPRFKLTSFDYLGLRKDSIQNMYPAIGDIDGNGQLDLIIGRLNGTVSHYVINGSGKNATASKVGDKRFGIQIRESSAPNIADVDGNGKLDLLIGCVDGNTMYYRNASDNQKIEFTKIRDTIGSIVPGYSKWGEEYDDETGEWYDSLYFFAHGYTAPFMADLDGDEDPEFLVGNPTGNIEIYRNTRRTGIDSFYHLHESPFYLSSRNICYNYNFGAHARPAVGDLNGDGKPDLVVCDDRGGFQFALASGDCNLSTRFNKHGPLSLAHMYPNPTADFITFKINIEERMNVSITDLSGKEVYTGWVNPTKMVDVSFLDNGIYVVELKTSLEAWRGKLIKQN